MAVNPIPEGMHTIQAYLVVKDAAAAMKYYEKAFGAKEVFVMKMPGSNQIMHAEVTIGDSILMLSEENPQWGTKSPLTLGGTPVTLHCYVPKVDETFNQAVAAGATALMPPGDMFWGDRMCKVQDPFGHHWSLASKVEDIPQDQMDKRAAEYFAKQGS